MPDDLIPVPRSLLIDLRLAAAIATGTRTRQLDQLPPLPPPTTPEDIAELTAERDRLKAAHYAAFRLLVDN